MLLDSSYIGGGEMNWRGEPMNWRGLQLEGGGPAGWRVGGPPPGGNPEGLEGWSRVESTPGWRAGAPLPGWRAGAPLWFPIHESNVRKSTLKGQSHRRELGLSSPVFQASRNA